MTEVIHDFAGVASEGPYGFKNSREDVMRPQFPGFDKLSQSDARLVVDVQMGLRKQCVVNVPGQSILVDHFPAKWIDEATGKGWGYVVRRIKSGQISTEPSIAPVKPEPQRFDWERERSALLEERARMDQDLAHTRDERAKLADKARLLELELREEREQGRKAQRDLGGKTDLEKKLSELEASCAKLRNQLTEVQHRADIEQQKAESLRQDLDRSVARHTSELERQKTEFAEQTDQRERLDLDTQSAALAELRSWQAKSKALDAELKIERDKSHIYVPGAQTDDAGPTINVSPHGALVRVIVIWAVAALLLARLLLPAIR